MPGQSDPNQNSSALPNQPTAPPMSDLPPLPVDLPPQNTAVNAPAAQVAPIESTPVSLPPTINSPKKKFGGGRIIATILGILLLVGGVGAGILLTQQKQLIPQKAQVVVCDPASDEECADAEEPLEIKSIPASGSPSRCSAQVFLNVNYTQIGCKAGKTCEGTGEPAMKTIVGWKGTALSDGPNEVIANSVKIPLTDVSGRWLKDFPVYRSSPDVTALGITRVGNGQILISHAHPYPKDGVNYASQGIDATMTLEGGTTTKFYNTGQTNLAPDPAGDSRTVLRDPENGSASQISTSGIKCNNDEIDWTAGASEWKHFTRACFPGDDYVMEIGCPAGTPPTTTPQCLGVKAYDSNFKLLTSTQLTQLSADTDVNFCVTASPSAAFDKAQFKIGDTVTSVTSPHQNPGDFCQAYTIKETDKTISVKAKVHHKSDDTWAGDNF